MRKNAPNAREILLGRGVANAKNHTMCYRFGLNAENSVSCIYWYQGS